MVGETRDPASRRRIIQRIHHDVFFDVGYAREGERDVGANGYAIRALATLGLIALNVRWVHFTEGDDSDHAEIGLLLKLPYPLTKEHRSGYDEHH